MKIQILALTAALASHAADINPKVFRMIGPNAMLVTGINVERHHQSQLSQLFPGIADNAPQSIWIENRDSTKLQILIGPQRTAPEASERPLTLDPSTRIQFFGQGWSEETEKRHDTALAEAARQFESPDAPPTALAARAQQLSGIYDDWFIIERPLEFIAGSRNAPSSVPLKYRDDLAKTIEELSGGIRYGSNDEVKVEAVMRTSDDAKALAALVRWVPGLIQLMAGEALPLLVDLAEDLTVTTDGRRVTLSCHFPEDKVAELNTKLKALRQPDPELVR